jgi:hypothetical protein
VQFILFVSTWTYEFAQRHELAPVSAALAVNMIGDNGKGAMPIVARSYSVVWLA